MLILLLCLICFLTTLKSQASDTVLSSEEQIHVGNLALRISQRPGPFFSFGQNVIEKGDLIARGLVFELKGCKATLLTFNPRLLYGLTDRFSAFIEAPAVIAYRDHKHRSSGLGSVIIEGECAVYVYRTLTSSTYATIVADIQAPAPAFKKIKTIFSSLNFFIGTTASYLSIEWQAFVSTGALITTRRHQVKWGNVFLYELGLGHNLGNPYGWILSWLLEFNGIYSLQEKVGNRTNSNSGGNVIFVGPSLFASNEHFVVQAGVQGVLFQKLFGKQSKSIYRLAASVAYTF